jgi:probable HAF family extracellular repeat protein
MRSIPLFFFVALAACQDLVAPRQRTVLRSTVSTASNITITDLGTLGGDTSIAFAINDQGLVVGSSALAGNGESHAFLWQNGTMTDLGTLGGTVSSAVAVNGLGQVVGSSTTVGNGAGHAFLWQNGTMIDLGTLGGDQSWAIAVNDLGQVLGESYTAGNSGPHAFLWQNGTMTDIGTLGGCCSATDVNGSGQVVGSISTTVPGESSPFLWQNGTLIDLGTFGGTYGGAVAVNDLGQVVGGSATAGNVEFHAFLWQNGSMTDLGTLGGFFSEAIAINGHGLVVGIGYLAGNAVQHSFIWQNGTMTDLGTLGGSLTGASAVNDLGEVVGNSALAGDAGYHAFLWQNGAMTDLGTLGGCCSSASAVNSNGQIAGWGSTNGVDFHAVLWEQGGVLTSAGSNVPVTLPDGVSLTFQSVTAAGRTTLTTSATGQSPPSGFALGTPAEYYDLSTTASFEGLVTVCIDYSGIQFETSPVSLFHFENNAWVDRTSSVDETNHVVCAAVSSFSPFVIAARIPLHVAIDIQPGSRLNAIKLSKLGKVPVAILSDASFDAVAKVVRASLTFGRNGNETSLASCARGGEDVNGDGFADLVCQFYMQKTGFQIGDLTGFLRGQSVNQMPIKGQDAVRILK